MTLNNPCINYLLQISAWNNVGKGNVTTLSLILQFSRLGNMVEWENYFSGIPVYNLINELIIIQILSSKNKLTKDSLQEVMYG